MSDIIASTQIKKYFSELKSETLELHDIANTARKTGIDPQLNCDIPIAASVAERVEAIMGSISPNLIGSGVVQRISELEKEYGFGDWRVALVLANEIASEKICKFEDKQTAISIGVRTGFAYITQGVVSAPLEGLIDVKIKDRKDGKKYLALCYAGPIRGGGATAMAVTTVIADYVRIQQGIEKYDPTDKELKRMYTEVTDYYERVERKQYKPTIEEIEFIVSNLPVEIDGDPTSQLQVSNYKGLERITTDRIRGGMALMLTDGLPLKGAKVMKKLNEWGKDFGLDWQWLNDYQDIKKRIHAKTSKEEIEDGSESKLKPNYAYIAEIVAGRPVFTHPLRQGGFRLRYGRSRLTGHGSWAISPITMQVLDNFLAVGTQLRVERPGKSTSLTSCDSIEGPIVKLKDGSVVKPETEEEAKEISKDVDEILYLGDLLISPGEFTENGHFLVPPGYCPEWWLLELKEAIKNNPNKKHNLTEDFINKFIPPTINFETALRLSQEFKIPIHPNFTFYFDALDNKQIILLKNYISTDMNANQPEKRLLELIGCPHQIKENKIMLTEVNRKIIELFFNEDIQSRPKFGTGIGARMGRPEKAKMRDMKGSPNFLFPVGAEGGRLRSFNESIKKGYITAEFPIIKCLDCEKRTIFTKCEHCNSLNTQQQYIDYFTKKKYNSPETPKCVAYERRKYELPKLSKNIRSNWEGEFPKLIKGVRETMNKFRYVEHPVKGVLRAKHSLRVNKDGTVRYDATELGTTHFTLEEIGLPIKKAHKLGYTHDFKGKLLTEKTQLVEIFPQDIILPSESSLGIESAGAVLKRVADFVDESLVNLYKLPAHYNIAIESDLIGQLVIGLAPHTSAGIIGRIIGFSNIAAIVAHPMWHAAQRRDLDGEETAIMLVLDAFLNFSRDFLPDRRGARSMDAPLVISPILNLKEVDDEVYDLNIAWEYSLDFYNAALEMKYPWDSKVKSIGDVVDKEEQYQNHGFTHSVSNMNKGVNVSAYKYLPTMVEKMNGQIELARKIRAVDLNKVGELIVNGHFIRDLKGNMRKFTMQRFRCVACNEKYRRIPLAGKCLNCGKQKVIYTISEGSVKKYLEPTLQLIEIDGTSEYLRETVQLFNSRIESVFGRDATKQIGLGDFIND
ncbi:MAG: DNA polymerase II large subunit [uncultured DHVE6 group euryarchaeote]|nr:MAG: DNA polymerase II large subunit [uncultured DHVE6 group euryarchaeote]